MNVQDELRIVEYEPANAESLADMWNRSRESWGGGDRIRTAESVMQELDNAANLHNFVALVGDEVVGFCSFSHYRNDEGALYVPLLNVRPDYHGRKVGKSLVLRAVEKTVEMGWPRLDLFTWAGNTKAVPMYKKCGFFWEKKEHSTHLMNFIPTVLRTEALAPYFERIDWYADCLRDLEIRPDGRTENGFDFFEYRWEKDGLNVRVEFEKTGRGLRLIETDDYLIRADIGEHDLVFGAEYPVRYVIRNKTGQPLTCTVSGRDDKNIRFTLDETVRVDGEAIVEGMFRVEPIEEEQSDWKTHPAVTAEWTINGKRALFKMGIAPKFPAKLSIAAEDREHYRDAPGECYVIIENNYKEPAEFTFTLPSTDSIRFETEQHTIHLPAGRKESIAIPYWLNDFGLYTAQVNVTAVPERSDRRIEFTKMVNWTFKGQTGMYGGETSDQWIAVNGPFTVTLNKTGGDLWAHHYHDSYSTLWLYPRLGRPYSMEFAKKKPDEVRVYSDGQTMVLHAMYSSDDFPGMKLHSIARLGPNGMIEHYYEAENAGERDTDPDLCLFDGVCHDLSEKGILPYNGYYIQISDPIDSGFDNWEVENISEPWLFHQGDRIARGFCWHPSLRLVKSEWHLGFEHRIGTIHPGLKIRTPSTYLAIGVYGDWFDFRSFALRRRDDRRPMLSKPSELAVGDGNPFVASEYTAKWIERKHSYLNGKVELTIDGGDTARKFERSYRSEEKAREARFDLAHPGGSAAVTITARYESASIRTERSKTLFPVSDEPVRRDIVFEGGNEVHVCSNGEVEIHACASFGGTVHSLSYRGREWLDTSYPTPGPRSWWNPWTGGIYAELQHISDLSLHQQPRNVQFVELTDSLGNEWSGLQIHTMIEQHEKLQGMELFQHYLLLPGAPLVCVVNQVWNGTGAAYPGFHCGTVGFVRPSDTLSGAWIRGVSDTIIRCGETNTGVTSEGVIRFGGTDRSEVMHLVTRNPGTDAGAYTNNMVIQSYTSQRLKLLDQTSAWTSPVFYLFNGAELSHAQLRDLTEIGFEGNL